LRRVSLLPAIDGGQPAGQRLEAALNADEALQVLVQGLAGELAGVCVLEQLETLLDVGKRRQGEVVDAIGFWSKGVASCLVTGSTDQLKGLKTIRYRIRRMGITKRVPNSLCRTPAAW
jgi:hypothetical protein